MCCSTQARRSNAAGCRRRRSIQGEPGRRHVDLASGSWTPASGADPQEHVGTSASDCSRHWARLWRHTVRRSAADSSRGRRLLDSVRHRLRWRVNHGLERGRAIPRRPHGERFATSRPVRSLILAALLLAGAVTISIVVLLSVLRERAIRASENEIATIASILAEQTNAEFRALELVETDVIDRID